MSEEKKFVLITGANGGMGKAFVSLLLERGYSVIGLDIVEGENKDNLTFIKADLTNYSSVEKAFDKVKEITDNLYAIVHFAGIYALDSLVEISSEKFEKVVKCNFFSAFNVNKAFSSLLSRGSKIIMITSELAPLYPLPFTGLYGVSKSALDKYAFSLKMELQLLGIYVSVLRAGAVDTNMLGVSTKALDDFCENTKLYSCNAKRFKKIVDRVEARKISPLKLAKKTYKILEKKRPKFAYKINRNPLLLLLNALPKGFQFWVIKKILR
ncbi:MAG: SDR family NAD(P)-dependent oxidoreductase [Clostridia bacterium]|nr:SDR family NAD(P)-dependent oxidoreductase [Clostridia bacterium]